MKKGTSHLLITEECIRFRESRRHGRQNRLIRHTSMLNERAGKFCKAVDCKVTRELKTGRPKMLKNTDDLALKQKCTTKFCCYLVFDVLTL